MPHIYNIVNYADILICSVATGAVAVVFNCTVENLFVFNYRLEHSLSEFRCRFHLFLFCLLISLYEYM